MSEHRPLPWYSAHEDGDLFWYIAADGPGGTRDVVAELLDPEDAAYIVRAANAHPALVAACRAGLAVVQHLADTAPDQDMYALAMTQHDIISAALKLAEAES